MPESLLRAAKAFRRLRHRPPSLDRYHPVPTLVTDEHLISTPACDVIDVHAHLGRWLTNDGSWMEPDLEALVSLLDRHQVVRVVNLDGRWGNELKANLDRYDRAFPGRFSTFCQLDWRLLKDRRSGAALAEHLVESAGLGAKGLKVWKDLGLHLQREGRLVLPDDAVLDPVWAEAGRLGLPVLIHVGDPAAFFRPVDECNERLDELLAHPRYSLAHLGTRHFERLLHALDTVVGRHPATTFIGAHVGCCAENLTWVGSMLDRHPNFNIDIAGRAAELGRQPRAAARFDLYAPRPRPLRYRRFPPQRGRLRDLFPAPRVRRRGLRILDTGTTPARPVARVGARPRPLDSRACLRRQRSPTARTRGAGPGAHRGGARRRHATPRRVRLSARTKVALRAAAHFARKPLMIRPHGSRRPPGSAARTTQAVSVTTDA